MSDEVLLEMIELLSEAMESMSDRSDYGVRDLEIVGRIDRVLAVLNQEAEHRGLRQSER